MSTAANRWLLGGTVVLLPLLEPRGPGQSAPVDAVAVVYVVVALIAIARSRQPLHLPAKGALLLILGASLLATVFGLDLPAGMLSILVEAYLFLLFLCVANHLGGDPAGLRAVLVTWSIAATAWAGMLIAFQLQVVPAPLEALLAGDGGGGPRAAGAAGNPNLAASYLLTSFFLLFASPWSRRRPARVAAAGALLFALYVTGSNGGLLGLMAGVPVLAVAAALRRTRTPAQRLGVVGGAVLTCGVVLAAALVAGTPRADILDVQALAQQERGGVFEGSIGRLDRSVGGRLAIWSSAWHAADSRVTIGVGPGSAPEIPLGVGTLKRGLHNDYLAFLIERGIAGLLGLLGLVALVAVLLRWSGRLLEAVLPDPRGGWLRPAGLSAAVVANLVVATNHESFHFRHVWILFGLVWAASRLVSGQPATLPAGPEFAAKELGHVGQ